jgi:hypothetical protein
METTTRPLDIGRSTELTPEAAATIEDMFEYHPWSTEQREAGRYVKRALTEAVKAIVENVPPCPDRSVAIRKLREARADCNSAISHNGKY